MLLNSRGQFEGFPSAVLPPPSWFTEAGEVRAAWPAQAPKHPRSRKPTPAQAAGRRYERKVFTRLKEDFGDRVLIQPWFSFLPSVGRQRYCQMDAILDLGGSEYTILEVKVRHTPDSWWQLAKLYLPVLRAYKPEAKFRLGTIVGSYDPATPYPAPFELVYSPEAIQPNLVGVLRWKL